MPKVTPLPVCDSDLANLRASGLTDRTIRAAKLRTEGGALVFPYHELDGSVNCFARRRPHNPVGNAKYIQPKGSTVRAYFPATCLDRLKDPRQDIIFGEGEKKAMATAQAGYAAVGLGGFWGGTKETDNGDYVLIDDLTALPLQRRTCLICFDYDAKPETRKDSGMARRRLAKALKKAGALEVHYVDLPPGKDGAKQGVDDFIVAHGAEAFKALVDKAMSPDPMPEADAMDLKSETLNDDFDFLPILGKDGYLVRGFSHVLSGSPKTGKTELLYQCVRDWLRDGETILWITEESKRVWQQRLSKLDIIDRRGLILVFGLGVEVDKLLDRVKRGTETVIIVDTLRGLNILGADENNNSEVARAIEPWVTACRADEKTFLGSHHARKSGGDHGKGIAGAHALVGAVDIVLELNHGKVDNIRTLSGLGRLIAPADLSYQMLEDGTMSEIAAGEGGPDILSALPTEEPGITIDDLMRVKHVSKPQALLYLNNGMRAGKVKRSGEGKRGSPYLYRAG